MKRTTNWWRAALYAAVVAAAGCSGSGNAVPIPHPTATATPLSSIRHVIILVQENRSFNSMFMGYPGAKTANSGPCKVDPKVPECKAGVLVKLHAITLETTRQPGGKDIAHGHAAFEIERDDGKLDGFDLINFGTTGAELPAKLYPYAYVERSETKPYWQMAQQYALGDEMFSTATTDSFVAHQEIIAATNELPSGSWVTDTPTAFPWGCDAPRGTVTSLLMTTGRLVLGGGPFPCYTWKSMADVLDAGSVSWKYYVACCPSNPQDFSAWVWNGFDAIENVSCVRRSGGTCVRGKDWAPHIISPNTTVLSDISKKQLAAVSWVIPTLADSDHPASACNHGPLWVSTIVDAVGRSAYWKSTAIVVIWDDWGGFYDPVDPQVFNPDTLGFRVPMLVISPLVEHGYVSHTQYDFGSILRFIEENFGTGSLGASDATANSIGDVFDFTQKARQFQPIPLPSPGPCTPSSAEQVLQADDAE